MKKLITVLLLLSCLVTSCKNAPNNASSSHETSESWSQETDSVNSKMNDELPVSNAVSSSLPASTGFDWGSAGSMNMILQNPSHGSLANTTNPVFKWTDIKAQSYSILLEEKNGSSYTPVKKSEGIKSNQYQFDFILQSNKTYRWRVEAKMDGKDVKHYGSTVNGAVFITQIDPKTNPANKGKDFSFDGKISEQVLKNYLSRGITLSCISSPSEDPQSDTRLILNTGAKYIARSIIPWQAETDYASSVASYKIKIDNYHKLDPDLIFETCIFETVFKSCEKVAIPDWVFKTFNMPVENRNFDYEKMIFVNGKHLNYWGDGASVPDITRLETQLYYYYRACCYIDAGFEAIHWGQVHLVGENDTGFVIYSKVINLVREYAKTHSRRHFVLNNAHTHGIIGPDGKLLMDFHGYPIRATIPKGQVAHAPSEGNPQKAVFELGILDCIYQRSLGGTTVSGWSCKSLPYFVELDNASGYEKDYLNTPYRDYWMWGMDDISWFANQPASYRASWLQYAFDWVKSNDPAGVLIMPGSRPVYLQSLGQMTWYYANSKDFSNFGWGDEDIIKEIWSKDNT